MPLFKRRPKHHHVEVYDTHPEPDERLPDARYVAVCECDWVGPFRETREKAFHDAYAHDANVGSEMKRSANRSHA